MNYSIPKNNENNFIEIIELSNRPAELGIISEKLIEIIRECLANNKKALLIYSRRGTASAWICTDCGFFQKCDSCDIAYTYHTYPKNILICHQCNQKTAVDTTCPHCKGSHFSTVGVGIEQLRDALQKIFRDKKISIIDSDHTKKSSQILQEFESASILVATNSIQCIEREDIGAILYPLFELNISIPNYDFEEELFLELQYHKKRHIPIYIQTYTPEHPLLQQIVFGNQSSYLKTLISERKKFLYPPYVDFATIWVHHRDKTEVDTILQGLLERIEASDTTDTFIAHDTDIWQKFQGDWAKKIILKGVRVSDILEGLQSVLVRSRYIHIQWH